MPSEQPGPAGVLDGVLARLGELGARLAFAAVVLLVVVLLGRAVRPLVRRRLERRGRPSVTRVFGGLFTVVVALVGFLVAATAAFPSVQVADVLASLGVVSVAVGFAFKDVLQNLLAGVLLLVRDPFQSGDEISVAGYDGVVEGATVRETLLRTFDGQRVHIPNATVYTNPIEVHTHHSSARSTFTVEVSPDTDLPRARAVASRALRGVQHVLAEPAPDAVVTQWSAGAVTLQCRVWSAADRRARTQALDGSIEAVQRATRSTDSAHRWTIWWSTSRRRPPGASGEQAAWPAGSPRCPMTGPDRLDVDARFVLANERTLLAWLRTALTFLAAGIGTLQLVEQRWRTGPGLGLLVLGAVAAGVGLVRYGRADRAIRQGRLPPTGHGPVLVAGAVALVAVLLTVLSAVRALG